MKLQSSVRLYEAIFASVRRGANLINRCKSLASLERRIPATRLRGLEYFLSPEVSLIKLKSWYPINISTLRAKVSSG